MTMLGEVCQRCREYKIDCQCAKEITAPDNAIKKSEMKRVNILKGKPMMDGIDEAPKQARLLTELSHEQLVARCLQLDYDLRHKTKQVIEEIAACEDLEIMIDKSGTALEREEYDFATTDEVMELLEGK